MAILLLLQQPKRCFVVFAKVVVKSTRWTVLASVLAWLVCICMHVCVLVCKCVFVFVQKRTALVRAVTRLVRSLARIVFVCDYVLFTGTIVERL